MRVRRHQVAIGISMSVVAVLAVIATLLTGASPVQRANEAVGGLPFLDGPLGEPHGGERAETIESGLGQFDDDVDPEVAQEGALAAAVHLHAHLNYVVWGSGGLLFNRGEEPQDRFDRDGFEDLAGALRDELERQGEEEAAGLVEEGRVEAVVNDEYREAHDAVEEAELILRE